MNTDEIYTSLEEAKEEIKRRHNDKELKKKVDKFLGGDIPHFLKGEPRAVFVRDIISPNNEFFYFWDIVHDIGLKPLLIEYKIGKFVAKNLNKYHLCKMYFYHGLGKNLGYKMDCQKVVDFNKMEGKRFDKIKTIWGSKIADFHHGILHKSVPNLNMNDIVDFSKWFNRHRKKTKFYYLHYLALFLCHGVLFDNFILNDDEREFTEKKIWPSLKRLTKIFGIKPLIVPIMSVETESDIWSWLYPGHVKRHLENK